MLFFGIYPEHIREVSIVVVSSLLLFCLYLEPRRSVVLAVVLLVSRA